MDKNFFKRQAEKRYLIMKAHSKECLKKLNKDKYKLFEVWEK